MDTRTAAPPWRGTTRLRQGREDRGVGSPAPTRSTAKPTTATTISTSDSGEAPDRDTSVTPRGPGRVRALCARRFFPLPRAAAAQHVFSRPSCPLDPERRESPRDRKALETARRHDGAHPARAGRRVGGARRQRGRGEPHRRARQPARTAGRGRRRVARRATAAPRRGGVAERTVSVGGGGARPRAVTPPATARLAKP